MGVALLERRSRCAAWRTTAAGGSAADTEGGVDAGQAMREAARGRTLTGHALRWTSSSPIPGRA